jgi:methylated-DNA-[protein]-cysteine S-methyltransferase
VTTISFGLLESEFGTITLALSARGLVRLALPTEPTAHVVDGLQRRYGGDIREGGPALDAARRTVEAYLAGHDQSLDVPVDWRIARGFTLTSLQRLAEVPYGTTVTYRELAARAGNERAPRAAGAACATNPVAIVVPCHRVLRSDGGLGGFGGGLEMKEALLRLEGVRI